MPRTAVLMPTACRATRTARAAAILFALLPLRSFGAAAEGELPNGDEPPNDLLRYSIEDLAKVEVSTPSKASLA